MRPSAAITAVLCLAVLARASAVGATDVQKAAAAGLPAPARGLAAAPAFAPAAVPRDPVTGLFGVTPAKLAEVTRLYRETYGDNLIDLAALGSRVTGRASPMKQGRPVTPTSDLDLVPLVRANAPASEAEKALPAKLREVLGFSVDIHTVVSFDGKPFEHNVPFYGAGTDTSTQLGAGAVRLPLPPPPAKPKAAEPASGFIEYYY